MTPVQCRMARTLLDIKLTDLAKLSGVGAKTIWNFENKRTQITRPNHDTLVRTFEQLGVEFLERDGVQRKA
jgi:transcriptional regulator with XRE-family HTH domain